MKKALPWSLAAASLLFFGWTCWRAAHPLVVFMTWKTAEANIISKRFYHSHDADGILIYGSELVIHYEAAGRPHQITVVSSNLPTDFPQPLRFFEAIRTDEPLKIRYDPKNPEKVEFDTTLRPALPYLLGALLAGLAIIPVRFFLRPKRRCSQCNTQLESYWRYCAECGEPATSSPSRLSPGHSPEARSMG